jgi:serine/threonine protein kinase
LLCVIKIVRIPASSELLSIALDRLSTEALLVIGEMLGHYQITSQLGKGGMGGVFRAKDQVLGRIVAIKKIKECMAGFSGREREYQLSNRGRSTHF